MQLENKPFSYTHLMQFLVNICLDIDMQTRRDNRIGHKTCRKIFRQIDREIETPQIIAGRQRKRKKRDSQH